MNIKINKLIFISSSSVYYEKKHIIGSVKLKCENFILKKKHLFQNYQIWRPFNLVGEKYVKSDHFHNHLFREMFLKKKIALFFLVIHQIKEDMQILIILLKFYIKNRYSQIAL